ncbi:MAG: hypothetical protein M3Z05_21850 [Gemmatimonadota bacterium]|nr:hypothetical protein [Gemmatimonadota bacterium]
MTECAVGALIANRELREAFLGDIAEEFAAHSAQHGALRAKRWYRAQAARSAPYLMARCWWPAPRMRCRNLGALLAGVTSGYVALQLLHQAAQSLVGLLLTSHNEGIVGTSSWSFVAFSLAAGAGSAVLGGCVTGRTFADAPLAGAFSLAVTCCVLGVSGMLMNGGVTPLWYWIGLQLGL